MAVSFRLSVRTKILSGFVLVFILFLSVLIYNLVQMRQIQWQLTIVQQGYLPLSRVVARIDNDQQGMERYLDPDRLLSRDNVPTNLYQSLAIFHLSRVAGSIRSGKEMIETTLSLPGVNIERRALTSIKTQFREIEREFNQYHETFRSIIGQIEAGDLQGARTRVRVLREQMLNVSRAIRDLNDMLEKRVEGAVEMTRRRQERAALMVAGLSSAAIIFGLITIFVTHLVLRPISRLIQGVKSIAGGDYAQRVAIEAEDEIGTLAREFNVMATSLEEREASLQRSRSELERALKDQKRAHQALEQLSLYNENIIRSIEVGLIVCDRDRCVTTLNPAAISIWGLEEVALLGRSVEQVPALGGLADVPRQVLETGEIVRMEGVEINRTSDGPQLVDATCVPLVGEQSAVQGVIILTEDVTERTRTKQRLIQNERLALIGRMSAQVTHEIRNPLNALGLNAELLQDEVEGLDPGGSSDARALLNSISGEIDRLTRVTETYLRLARLPTPRLEKEDVGSIIESLLSFLREELKTREIKLTFSVRDRLPEAMVDENQLRQALLNILRNSSEAMERGGTIDVQVAPTEAGIEVAIQDDGEGMSPEILQHIFDPFYSTKSSGTGLGLPIAQQIIEEHGGQIMCESRQERGTTFRIRLPAA